MTILLPAVLRVWEIRLVQQKKIVRSQEWWSSVGKKTVGLLCMCVQVSLFGLRGQNWAMFNWYQVKWVVLFEHTAVETWVNPSGGPNLASPKSDSFAFHCSSRRMFEDLKSRKIICKVLQRIKIHTSKSLGKVASQRMKNTWTSNSSCKYVSPRAASWAILNLIAQERVVSDRLDKWSNTLPFAKNS